LQDTGLEQRQCVGESAPVWIRSQPHFGVGKITTLFGQTLFGYTPAVAPPMLQMAMFSDQISSIMLDFRLIKGTRTLAFFVCFFLRCNMSLHSQIHACHYQYQIVYLKPSIPSMIFSPFWAFLLSQVNFKVSRMTRTITISWLVSVAQIPGRYSGASLVRNTKEPAMPPTPPIPTRVAEQKARFQ
jgi:hypothetical protein